MDSPKLKPCPHCGCTDVIIEYGFGKNYILCRGCRMTGPHLYGAENAVQAWNSLPRRHEITPNSVDCQGYPERRYRSHAHD